MKITVHGSGYVGAVAAACFASMGNDVHCVDTNPERVAMFNALSLSGRLIVSVAT